MKPEQEILLEEALIWIYVGGGEVIGGNACTKNYMLGGQKIAKEPLGSASKVEFWSRNNKK